MAESLLTSLPGNALSWQCGGWAGALGKEAVSAAGGWAGAMSARRIAAVLVVIGYIGLVAVAPACLFGVSPLKFGPHHHHSTGAHAKESHSSLCAWACQAGSSLMLVNIAGMSPVLFLLLFTVIAILALFTQIAWASARPHSPPLPVG